MTRPRLEEAARLKDEFPEINIGNYNDDDVARLNAWGCEVHDLLAALALPPDGDMVSARLLARHQPCGCVVCICYDGERCHGCGAKKCGTETCVYSEPGFPRVVYQDAHPPDGGEVVAKATTIIHAQCVCCDEDAEGIANALHAAGLLAGPWDRERLAEIIQHKMIPEARMDRPKPSAYAYRMADAILREVGR